MDVSGHDAYFRFSRGNDSRGVGAYQVTSPLFDILFDFNHIKGGDAFGYADDYINAGLGGFHYSVSRKVRGHKNG